MDVSNSCTIYSRLDILSSAAEIEFLRSIDSLAALSENEDKIIQVLNDYATSSGITSEHGEAAKQSIFASRQAQTSLKSSAPGAFDRLIYLLERYLEYCRSKELYAWPIDHLKISLWLKNDVTMASTSTRMRPLRKTVRCYVTSLESIRVKTSHHFPIFPPFDEHLVQSRVITQILEGLSTQRENLQERLSGNELLLTHHTDDDEASRERALLITKIESESGDTWAVEAMKAVQDARNRDIVESIRLAEGITAPKSKTRKTKPDPHLHTLKRYRNFCFLNRISMWPIDGPRVALWLRECVLVAEPRIRTKKPTISLRTVQVYLSRLEYARTRTEHLFQAFSSYGVSLYKSREIMQILGDLSSTDSKAEEVDGMVGKAEEEEEEGLMMLTGAVGGDHPGAPTSDPLCQIPCRLMPAALETVSEEQMGGPTVSNKRKHQPDEVDASEIDPKRRALDQTARSLPAGTRQVPDPASRLLSQSRRPVLRDYNERRTPSFAQESPNPYSMANQAWIRQPLSRTPSTPGSSTPSFGLPSSSGWASPARPTPFQVNKGSLAFLCSGSEEETGLASPNNYETVTPLDSPIVPWSLRAFPSSNLSPTAENFWSTVMSSGTSSPPEPQSSGQEEKKTTTTLPSIWELFCPFGKKP